MEKNKYMTSEELAKVFMKNINAKVREALEKVNEKLTEKIEIIDLFPPVWEKDLKFGVDQVVDGVLKNQNSNN